jgi:hypothetical protein
VGEVEDVASRVVAGGIAFDVAVAGDPCDSRHDGIDDDVVELRVAARPRRTTGVGREALEQRCVFLCRRCTAGWSLYFGSSRLAVADHLAVHVDDRMLAVTTRCAAR